MVLHTHVYQPADPGSNHGSIGLLAFEIFNVMIQELY